MSARSPRVGRVAPLALALVVAACEATPSVAPSPTPPPEPTATVTTYRLGTTVWYAGFVMVFGDATATLDRRGGTLSVSVQLQNPTQDGLTLDSPVRLTLGDTYLDTTRETVLPSVPAGGSGFTTLHYEVIGRSSVDDGVLTVGDPGLHQAVIPLTPGSVAPVTFKPVDLNIGGSAAAGDLRVVLRHGVLRWDLPDWGDELPATSASLTLTYDAAYGGSFSGGIPFTGDNISLILPNGKVVHPRADGRSQSLVVIGAGKVIRNLFTRFEIPANLPGTYTLVVGLSGAQGKIPFKAPG